MSTLAQLAQELVSWFPDIDPLGANALVFRAYKDIRDSRDWSYLKRTGCWFAPNQITAGTVTTTQFSTSVVADSVAAPAINAVGLTLPPQQPLSVRQFRVNGGPIYNITAWAYNNPSPGLGTITIDRPYAETGGAGRSYMVYQPYVPAPSTDFKQWLSWVDPLNNYRFRYRNLFWTQKEVDKRDPNRQSWSIPVALAAHDYITYPGDTAQRPRFEAWPHPIQQIGYIIEYLIKGDSVGMNDYLPFQVTDQCILAHARHYGHQLVANQPNVDVKVKAFHLQAMKIADAEAFDLLHKCHNEDNSIFDSRVVTEETGPQLSGPLDAEYLQSHVVYYLD